MMITYVFWQALQLQPQHVVNLMFLFVLQKLLLKNWEKMVWIFFFFFLTNVTYFCVRHDIEILHLDDFHSIPKFRNSHLEENQVTIEIRVKPLIMVPHSFLRTNWVLDKKSITQINPLTFSYHRQISHSVTMNQRLFYLHYKMSRTKLSLIFVKVWIGLSKNCKRPN